MQRLEKTAETIASNTVVTKRLWMFGCWIIFWSVIFVTPLIALFRMAFSQDDASYLVLIPFISAWVFFVERRKILRDIAYDKLLGGGVLFLAGCAAVISHFAGSTSSLRLQLSGYILSLALFWLAGFILLFGRAASKAGYFPLLFLFLMVPLPISLVDHVTYLLQVGSAWVTGGFFNVLGVPVLRDGLIFHLARVNIEVAKECSGIRSSIAMLILTLLVVHFYLKSFWRKALFLASGLFMMILKNGIRIATLTLLAMYVDPSFLYGKLHQEGGVVFFVLSLVLLAPLLWLLQHRETLSAKRTSGLPSQVGHTAITVR